MKTLTPQRLKSLFASTLIVVASFNPYLMLSAQTKTISKSTKTITPIEVPRGLSQEDEESLREFALEYFGDSPNITEAQILNAVTIIAAQAPHLKAPDGTRIELDQNFFAALAEYRRTGSHHLALIWGIPIIVWIIIDVATTTTTAHAPVVEIPPTEDPLCRQMQEQFDRTVQDLISRPAPSAEICEYLQAMRHLITTCQWGASSRVRDLVLNYCPEI
jgi:hypothetical protein